MKGGRRTAKGRIINIDDVIAASPHTTAVGNMRVNAQGDELGPGGEVTKTREQRARAYYKDHPQASNRKVSLKGDMQDAFEYSDVGSLRPDTADTAKENVRTRDMDPAQSAEQDPADAYENQEPVTEPEVSEQAAPEPDEFNEVELPPELDESDVYQREPDGYQEIELDNGDIMMQPYWIDKDDA